MKETPQPGHIIQVATETCQIPSLSNTTVDGQGFDDDDNEGWELGVGNLIIDLDADLERNNTSPISDPSPTSKMSSFEHQATVVDKGLKMKIKRKSGGKSSDNKHEIVKNDPKLGNINESGQSASNSTDGSNSTNSTGPSTTNSGNTKSTKTSPGEGKEKTVKGRSGHKKDKISKDKPKNTDNSVSNGLQNSNSDSNSQNDSDKVSVGIKREASPLDPYEFNAKVEDRISMPMKKIKVEKQDNTSSSGSSISAPSVDVSTATSHVGTITEPECLGACEPGTSVCLEGIVWQETENGVLVVNVTWRDKTYVGTLLDATKHDWAPPRFSCDSPTSDLDARTPKRGGNKRGARGSTSSTPVNNDTSLETRKLRKGRRGNGAAAAAPPSPAKSDISTGVKRKGRPADLDLALPEDLKSVKRYRSNSRGTPTTISSLALESSEPALIECPEPNCKKKYRHINGLRYHQTHAHSSNSSNAGDDKDKENSSEDSRPSTPTESISSETKTTGRRTPKSKDNADKNKNQNKSDKNESKSKDSSDNNSKSANSTKSTTSEELDASSSKTLPSETPVSVSSTLGTCVTTASSSQVFQITGTNVTQIGNLTVVQKPMDTTAHVIGQSTATTITAVTVPITTVATIPAPIVNEKDEKKKKGDKGKSKSGQRQIVPAATGIPQVITLTTNGPLTHSTMAAPQISPTSNLKPIQPKPTTEPSTVNPVLAGLQKEKKPKKKKKDKGDREASKSASTTDKKDDVTVKTESVIKANPSISSSKSSDNSEDKQKRKSEQTNQTSVVSNADQKQTSQQVQPGSNPPTSLNLNSPVAVNTQQQDATDPGNENVQSPAYSDISDANEAAPQLDSETEGKTVKEPPKCPSREGMNTPDRNSDPSIKPYGMYSYYGQPPYLIPTIQKGQMTPTHSNTPASTPPAGVVSTNEVNNKKVIDSQPVDATTKSANVDKSVVSSNKDDTVLIKNIKKEFPDPQQSQDYQQQKMQQQPPSGQQQQQMYARGLAHPQYSYMGAYGYAMDPAYHMHLMATDPHYKQQHELYMEEQERLRKEQLSGKSDIPSPNTSEQRTPVGKPTSTEAGKSDERSRNTSPSKIIEQSKIDKKYSDSRGNENDSDQPVNLKSSSDPSKVMKDNIVIKTEPGTRKEESPHVVQDKLREKHQEELQRYYMYQQQKMMEQHDPRKRAHGVEHHSDRHKSDHSKQRDYPPTSGKSTPDKSQQKESTRPGKVPTPQDNNKRDRDNSIDRGREGNNSRDGREMKHRDDKHPHRVDDKRGSPAMTNKPKDMTSSVSHSGATMVQGAYPGYMGHPYAHPHYAAQLPVHYVNDPNHPMYRNIAPMMGYPGHPYMHPAQIRYMAPVDHPDKDKIPPMPSPSGHGGQPPPGVIPDQPKALDLLQQHASYYASQQHKIHELEKVKPEARLSPKIAEGSSPLGNKSKPEYTNSPPPQRHLHTHHHTHLMGGYPPGTAIYDPYGAIIASQQAAAAAAAGIPPGHPYAGK